MAKHLLRLSISTLALIVTGCSDDSSSSTPNPINNVQNIKEFGAFSSDRCFRNKAASEGIGQDVYTLATITFNNDGTGLTEFRLFLDSACATEVNAGSLPITYEVVSNNNELRVMRITQHDENNPGNDFTFYLPIKLFLGGAYVHINGTRSDAAPYATEPTEQDLAAFAADPVGVGVSFTYHEVP